MNDNGIDNKTKLKIINYCKYILNYEVDPKFIEFHGQNLGAFLENLFEVAKLKFLKTGSYDINEDELLLIYHRIIKTDQYYYLLKYGKVKVKEIKQNGVLVFESLNKIEN